MENKVVVFPELVSQLSETTSTSEILCESFLKTFFALASERLEQGDSVEVKHIGVFLVTEEGIVFEASEEIRLSVNAAFECFEPIELDDKYNDREVDEIDLDGAGLKDALEAESEDLADVEDGQVDVIKDMERLATESPDEEILDGSNGTEGIRSEESDPFSMETEVVEDDVTPVSIDDGRLEMEAEEGVAPRCAGRLRFIFGFLSGVAIMLVVILVLWLMGVIDIRLIQHQAQVSGGHEKVVVPMEDKQIEDSGDSVAVTKVEPDADENPSETAENLGVYKVTRTAYLSNISRKYYGHYVFWVYIYLENKDLIKDPDNLPIGVELKIPSPVKYGIDKDDESSVKKAELKAFEVKNGKI